MSSKGQVIIEYLTTYGWVILIVIIGISTLGYFGLLSPSKLVPEKCNFGTQITCEDFSVQEFNPTTSLLRLRVRNNLAKSIQIDAVDSLNFEYTFSNCIGLPIHIAMGEREDLECDIDAGFLIGEKKDIAIQLTFRNNDTGPPVPESHSVKGIVITSVT